MKQELVGRLFNKYPSLFKRKDLSLHETCMCWGIECGDGWYNLLNDMCKQIIESNSNTEFEQIKVKYGTLRVYAVATDPIVDSIISKAEHRSASTCDVCGERGKINDGPWYRVRCESCK